MGIWRIILSCLTVLILSGCAISIDEPSPQADDEHEQSGTEQDMRQDEQQAEEETKHSSNVLTQIFEHFFEPTPEDLRQIDDDNAKQLHYLALGDSLTDGVGDEYSQDGYVGRFADSMLAWTSISEVKVENRGKRGRRSDELLKLLKKGHYDEELQQAQLISLTMGGNDVMKDRQKGLV
ncbi:Lysophospholipase OS=Lysinibacillus sphaericus OX=1421 GN=LS41612_11240 PE=4 SV=1 [Lysinibacillus sphaericus]